jgi:hypothetical protein
MINLAAPYASLVLEIDELLHGPLNPSTKNRNQRLRRAGVWRGDPMLILTGDSPQPQPPGEWVRHANCLGQNHMFALPVGSMRASQRRMQQLATPAKELCDLCRVRTECRDWALSTPDPAVDHVAAGMTPYERQQERRRLIGLRPI